MIARSLRSIVAAFLLLSALLSGAMADGLRCSELEQQQQGHALVHVADGAGHHGAADSPIGAEGGAGTVEHEVLGCHSAGTGCPGCIAPAETTSAIFSEGRVAYTFSNDIGHPISSVNNLRPPIQSI